jgi:AraC-like DNA-binding protein
MDNLKYKDNYLKLFKLIQEDKIYPDFSVAYHYRAHSEWNFKNKSFEFFYLMFVKSGTLKYHILNEDVTVSSGHILLLTPNTPYDVEHDINNPPLICPVLFALDMKADSKWFILYRSKNEKNIQFLIEKLFSFFIEKTGSIYKRLCSNIVFEILAIIGMELTDTKKDFHDFMSYDNRVQRAKLIIESEPFKRYSSDELASNIGLSPKQLTRLFKQHYLMTPKEYEIYVRMKYATHLLYENKYSIPTIASMLGYTDPFAFSKQYKKKTGNSPSVINKTIRRI